MTDGQYLDNDEINEFLDQIDHDNKGYIEYKDIQMKLDHVHGALFREHHHRAKDHTPCPHCARLAKDDDARHQFLSSMMGSSDAERITRQDFAELLCSWKIPSLAQNKKQEDEEKSYVRRLPGWRKIRAYWAVRGPEVCFIGLVIGLQLAFGIWQLVKYDATPEYRAALGWRIVMAKTCAGALYPTFFFLILSMSRYTSTWLRTSYHVSRFINWDLSQEFHIYIACVAILLATLHSVAHLTGTFVRGVDPAHRDAVGKILDPDSIPRSYAGFVRSIAGFTGVTGLGLIYILSLLSIPQVRRWNYEVFQLAHLLMFPIIGLMMAHGTASLLQWPMFGYFLAFPTLMVLVERLIRVALGFHHIRATMAILDDETMEIIADLPSHRLSKYKAGQYIFLRVPKISFFQWHPFTVSFCRDQKVMVHIKADGNWTRKLHELGGQSDITEIEVSINGPFGAPAQRFFDFQQSVIIGTGIGVTPFSGILEEIFQLSGRPDFTLTDDYRRVDFHWTVRDRNHLLWFSDLLNQLDIRINTHVTAERKDIVIHVFRWLLEMHRTEEHPTSPLTGLLNPTHFGRPDFDRILDDHYNDMYKLHARKLEQTDSEKDSRASSAQDSDIKVGVFYCGSPVVGEILADKCKELSVRGRHDGSKTIYHFITEVFG
ncbi:FAD-binding domain-containing protein [Hirsutella rhossiliensis]|uniref:FAD-binding domain-containing protein n=1 Tax=Hirsutella rhossiliensis TaxID=111463 RepID=A0A9P8SM10_9HYPO|nr:FAD-binding domain-containing protein [Hirsutella rhossiliensis]KAH0967501.1 FAD-binding domain-containing protein [Hirsutella rhossiliensis]